MSSIRIAIARMEREITTLKRRVNDLETEVANIKKTRPNRTTETNTGDVELMVINRYDPYIITDIFTWFLIMYSIGSFA